MNRSFNQMTRLLNAIWHELEKTKWTEYAGKSESDKCTGIIMCVGDRNGPRHDVIVGHVPERDKLKEEVFADQAQLANQPRLRDIVVLMESVSGLHAGTIRSSVQNDELYSLRGVGMPEIGNHLTLVSLMSVCETLSLGHYSRMANKHMIPLSKLLKRTGVTPENFDKLSFRLMELALAYAPRQLRLDVDKLVRS